MTPPHYRRLRPIVVSLGVTLVAVIGLQGPAAASEQPSDVAVSIARAAERTHQDPATENPAVTLPTDGASTTSLVTEEGLVEFDIPAVGDVQEKTSAGVIVDGAAPDTIVAVESTAEGVRALIHIESASAPERFAFPVSGDVASLELNDDGSVNALDAEENVLAVAQVPWAIDQAGRKVPTHYEISGTTLTQVVQHRGGGFDYGITADPSWVWWTTKIATCTAAAASLLVAPLKLLGLKKKINASKDAKKAVDKAGGLKNVLRALIAWVKARGKLAANSKYGKVIKTVGKTTLGLITLVIGSSCNAIYEEVWK